MGEMAGDDPALLARLDERTKSIVDELKALRGGLVTLDRFRPVEMLVYGMAGTMLLSLLGAIIYVVIPHGAR